MNLGDPELELVDPTPNVHSLFLHFDQVFFWTKLASRAVVRWSKRMYSCAGTCSYDRGGLCDIALSEPLLKLRPRKDLIETLLHEMIHAYLFVTCRDQDRDGHGPNFKEHMHRINRAAGLNISIYHDFHDEVELYKTHWWRCNGPCQTRKPHFGIVRRSANRAPGPLDYWWKDHLRKCGGTFIKIKEPENKQKAKKKGAPPKPCGDITKYINTDTNTTKAVLKDSNSLPVKTNINKSNSTIVVSKKNNVVFNPKPVNSIIVFSGKGHTLTDSPTKLNNVTDTVRNVWANKQLSPLFPLKSTKSNVIPNNSKSPKLVNTSKHKLENPHILSPPAKVKKIDDYFKSTATSILKDIYGKDFEIKETNNKKRLSVVSVEVDLVACPVCNLKIDSQVINRHLDECLNKDIIENICSDNVKPETVIKREPKMTHTVKKPSPNIKIESDVVHPTNIKSEPIDSIDLTYTHIKDEQIFEDVNSNIVVINKDGQLDRLKKEKVDFPAMEINPSTSKDNDKKDTVITLNEQICPCCATLISTPIEDHLDECLAFSDNNTTNPTEGASTSYDSETIVLNDDDDDIFDETLTLNATGTKSPCPCCLEMIEQAVMNEHLDICLS